MRAVTLALRTLLREWKSGELGVLVLAITVAVAALTGVGFLVDRIGIAVDNQAGEVLAADLAPGIRRSRWTTRPSWRRKRRGLDVARNTGLLQRGIQRRRQPAHGAARGLRRISAARQGAWSRTSPLARRDLRTGIPARGEVWPESRLAAALGASVGSELSTSARASSAFRAS